MKGRWDERKKLEGDIDVDKEVLNEESRGHYHDEIVKEVEKLNGSLPEGSDITLTVPHENFNRDIGNFGGKNCYTDGRLFEGSDDEYATYIQTVLPTAADEEALKEIFKQQWVEDKPLTPRQLASGIGATA